MRLVIYNDMPPPVDEIVLFFFLISNYLNYKKKGIFSLSSRDFICLYDLFQCL